MLNWPILKDQDMPQNCQPNTLKEDSVISVGVGGDGTLNEISRPLVNEKNVTVGIIPAGTGNDFIQILGFPNRFGEKEWDIFFNARVIKMDVGSC